MTMDVKILVQDRHNYAVGSQLRFFFVANDPPLTLLPTIALLQGNSYSCVVLYTCLVVMVQPQKLQYLDDDTWENTL